MTRYTLTQIDEILGALGAVERRLRILVAWIEHEHVSINPLAISEELRELLDDIGETKRAFEDAIVQPPSRGNRTRR